MLRYTKGDTLKGKYTLDDPPRNELEGDQQDSVHSSQVHHYGANGEDDYADDVELAWEAQHGDADAGSLHKNSSRISFLYVRGASRKSLGSVVGKYYDGRVSVL